MHNLRLSIPWTRRLKRIVTRPVKGIARWGLRKLCFAARFPMMYFYSYSYLISTSAFVVAKLGIPDLLKNGPKSITDLAKLTGADEPTLFRVMRALVGFNVFDEVEDRVFAITPLGEMLQSDRPDSLYYWSLHFGEDVFPALPHLLNQVKTGEQAFTKAHGMPLWDYLEADEERGLQFDKKMSLFTDKHSPAIVKAFDFSGVGTLVDVGGGRGSLIIEILRTFPDVRGILYDRPEVTPDAKRCIERAGLSDRCDVASGSFLESVPGNGDAYVFKHVFHDWDDGNVLKMLRNCRRVMNEGDTLFVVEGFVGHTLFGWDGYRRWCDVYQMMCLFGKERTLDEMQDLLSQAGFEMVSLTPTSIVDVSILKTKAVQAPAIAAAAAAESAPTASS